MRAIVDFIAQLLEGDYILVADSGRVVCKEDGVLVFGQGGAFAISCCHRIVGGIFGGLGHCSELVDSLRQRSEEHTSELQSRENLVCRLLLEKKNNPTIHQLQKLT